MHEALDQIGAVTGPLIAAAVLAVTGSFRPALLALAIPGVAVLVALVWLRARVPHPADYEPTPPPPQSASPSASMTPASATRARLPAWFWAYAGFTVLTMSGLATLGVLSFHLAVRGPLSDAAIPVVYAAEMGTDALTALATGFLYNRYGTSVLAALPPLAAAVPVLAFSMSTAVAIGGSLLWGAA